MSIESIIGITSGLIGIISAIIASICWVKKKVKKCPASELFKMLMQKNISDSKRREILIKLNNSSLINKKIKEEYIQNFRLENRGQETVLFDIFDSNDIEPTDDICKGLIGVCMPSLRKRYQEKRQNKQEVSFSEPKQII